MLPILRIIPVGGVLLAIAITVLALSAPDGARSRLARVEAPARGPLVDRETHPEWRQFLIQAALRRAGELERLRELPDTPARSELEPGSDEPPQPATEAEPPLIVEPVAVAEEHADADAMRSETPVAPLPAAPVLPVEGAEVAALQVPAAPDDHGSAPLATPAKPTRIATLLDNAVAPIKRSDAMALQAPSVADDASAASASPLNLEQVALSQDDGDRPIKSTGAADSQESAEADEAAPPVESNGLATTQQPVVAGNTPANSTSQPKPTEVTLLLGDVGPPIEGSDIAATQRPDASGNPTVDPSTQPKSTEAAPTLDKVDLPVESSDSAEPQEAETTVVDDASVAPKSEPKSTGIAPSHDDPSSPVDRSDTVAPQTIAAPATKPEAKAPRPDDETTNVASLTLDGDTGTAEDETGAVGGPEDGSPDAVDNDEATLSKTPVALPRERPPGIIEPHKKKRAVRRRVRRTRSARPTRTAAANNPVTYNFFEALLRMLSANAPPPNAAMSRRMTRPLY